ncbi:MAG: hypothetical protein K8S24_12370 [Candidatus Aegiribacteria sp.]|nr:hypothetical protein [Candidatus Aegiribacteria sp.]
MLLVMILFTISSPVIVSGGPEIDYQPSPVQDTDGRLVVAFERLTSPSQGFIGDIWITFSADTGSTWAAPIPVVTSSSNLRHPSLVRVPSGGYRVFYLSDQIGTYKIFSVFSPDGVSWNEEGEVDLGWSSTVSIGNPTVSPEGDSALVLSYDRFFGLGGYVARSTDGGETWDTQLRRINVKGRLNRIIKHSDGTYLCSWQETGGGTIVNIFASYSTDLINWAASDSLTTNDNGHDSMPFVDASGLAWIFYAKHSGSVYEVMRRGIPSWGSYGNEDLIYSGTHNATQPHPLLLSDGRIALFWGDWWASYNESDVMMEILDLTGINDDTPEERELQLHLWPCPFTSSLNIQVAMLETGEASLYVFDTSGRMVENIFSGMTASGTGNFTWTPDENLPIGVYQVRLISDRKVVSGSCLLMR